MSADAILPFAKACLDQFNSLDITGDQLKRALTVYGREGAIEAFADAEGMKPMASAVAMLNCRRGLFMDFVDGPGVPDHEHDAHLEAVARVRLIEPTEDSVPLGDSGVCFDDRHFDELLELASELPW